MASAPSAPLLPSHCRGAMGWVWGQPQKLELHPCRTGYALQTGFLKCWRGKEKVGCKRKAVSFSEIQKNRKRLPKKIYCQNRKLVCCCLQLEDSRYESFYFFFFWIADYCLHAFSTQQESQCNRKTAPCYSLFAGQGFSCHQLFTSQLAAAIPGRPQKSPGPAVRIKKGMWFPHMRS